MTVSAFCLYYLLFLGQCCNGIVVFLTKRTCLWLNQFECFLLSGKDASCVPLMIHCKNQMKSYRVLWSVWKWIKKKFCHWKTLVSFFIRFIDWICIYWMSFSQIHVMQFFWIAFVVSHCFGQTLKEMVMFFDVWDRLNFETSCVYIVVVLSNCDDFFMKHMLKDISCFNYNVVFQSSALIRFLGKVRTWGLIRSVNHLKNRCIINRLQSIPGNKRDISARHISWLSRHDKNCSKL